MSQDNFNIPDSNGVNFLTNLNTALQALASGNSGAGDPGVMYPYEEKANTATGYKQRRNPGNDAWYDIGLLDTRVPTATYANNTYSVVYTPAITEYKDGIIYIFRAENVNTGGVFFSANGLPEKQIKKMVTGLEGVLGNGEVSPGLLYPMVFNSSSNHMILLNPGIYNLLPNAYIYDLKVAGTEGGTFTSGSWQTRTLNSSDAGFSISLSGNQFTLGAGYYRIRISAPAYEVNSHQVILYNITDGIISLVGSSEYSPVGSGTTRSVINGRVITGGSKVFEVRHRCTTTNATDGLGKAANFGQNEIYTQVEIWQE